MLITKCFGMNMKYMKPTSECLAMCHEHVLANSDRTSLPVNKEKPATSFSESKRLGQGHFPWTED